MNKWAYTLSKYMQLNKLPAVVALTLNECQCKMVIFFYDMKTEVSHHMYWYFGAQAIFWKPDFIFFFSAKL